MDASTFRTSWSNSLSFATSTFLSLDGDGAEDGCRFCCWLFCEYGRFFPFSFILEDEDEEEGGKEGGKKGKK